MTAETVDLTSALWTLPTDHEGSAKCVIELFPGLYRFTRSHGWLAYNGKYWEVQADDSVGRAIVHTLRQRSKMIEDWAAGDEEKLKASKKMLLPLAANNWSVKGIEGRLRDLIEVKTDIARYDTETNRLNVNNGVINLMTGELEPHSKDDFFTYCLDIDYDEDAYCPEWEEFLESSVDGEDMLSYLQTVAGYLLTGEITEEVLFYIYGPTRSGKGTFTETIKTLMGPLAIGQNFRTFTADRTGDTQSFDLAPLKNKRVVIASESRKNERLNEAVLKQVTGGDDIFCSFKYQTPFSYRPQFKIVLTSNHAANADPTDEAAWTRLQVIHFPHSKAGQENRALKGLFKTRKAVEGVLAWMVAGAVDWYANGIQVPAGVRELTSEQRLSSNTVAGFINDCCEVGDADSFEPGTMLYRRYSNWCEAEGYKPLGRKNFTLAAKDLGFDDLRQVAEVSTNGRKESKRVRGFAGLRFVGFNEGDESLSKLLFSPLEVSQNGHEVSQVSQKEG